ncbi:MAG: hypothetical protein IPK97_04825 [Ahniella sp.]|nr:hypothetical protein [Ahniella sp.]
MKSKPASKKPTRLSARHDKLRLKLEQFSEACAAASPWRVLGLGRATWTRHVRDPRTVPTYIVRSIEAHLRLLALGSRGQAAFSDLVLRATASNRLIGTEDEQLPLDL